MFGQTIFYAFKLLFLALGTHDNDGEDHLNLVVSHNSLFSGWPSGKCSSTNNSNYNKRNHRKTVLCVGLSHFLAKTTGKNEKDTEQASSWLCIDSCWELLSLYLFEGLISSRDVSRESFNCILEHFDVSVNFISNYTRQKVASNDDAREKTKVTKDKRILFLGSV